MPLVESRFAWWICPRKTWVWFHWSTSHPLHHVFMKFSKCISFAHPTITSALLPSCFVLSCLCNPLIFVSLQLSSQLSQHIIQMTPSGTSHQNTYMPKHVRTNSSIKSNQWSLLSQICKYPENSLPISCPIPWVGVHHPIHSGWDLTHRGFLSTISFINSLFLRSFLRTNYLAPTKTLLHLDLCCDD